MNAKDFSEMATTEVCERAAGLLVDIADRCELEGCPLTEEQRKYLNTGVLAAFFGVGDALERMVGYYEVLRQFSDSPFLEPLTDEGLAAWLSEDDGPLQ